MKAFLGEWSRTAAVIESGTPAFANKILLFDRERIDNELESCQAGLVLVVVLPLRERVIFASTMCLRRNKWMA